MPAKTSRLVVVPHLSALRGDVLSDEREERQPVDRRRRSEFFPGRPELDIGIRAVRSFVEVKERSSLEMEVRSPADEGQPVDGAQAGDQLIEGHLCRWFHGSKHCLATDSWVS